MKGKKRKSSDRAKRSADITPLPSDFVAQLQEMLGNSAEAFFDSVNKMPIPGLRVNTNKILPETLQSRLPWLMQPISWSEGGFELPTGTRAGKHPYHAAGLYYLQDPSAMAAAAFLDVKPGQLVLDIAASPGGKSTHLASLLAGSGVLVSNDPVRSRIPALQQNLERWGTINALITNLSAEEIARTVPGKFDRVLVDAPCSGEGLFRKQQSARAHWSLNHVAGCVERQALLLDSAALTVKPHGLMMYSTCTFNVEENERQIASFLDRHSGWELQALPSFPGIAQGNPDWLSDGSSELLRMARFWPHLTVGEGQTLALLRAPDNASPAIPASTSTPDTTFKTPDPESQAIWDAFRKEVLPRFATNLPIAQAGDRLYLLRREFSDVGTLPAITKGLLLGYLRKRRFEPSHALALAIDPPAAVDQVFLDCESAVPYLCGAPIYASGPAGWTLVCVDEFGLGWGKRTGDSVKNHYPKGLRWHGR